MSAELLDVVNEQDEIIGQATRDECHSNPQLIHRVAHCWIFNSQGQLLWQQRSLSKKESPGKWDMSCGGHIPAGERVEFGLKRELEEELDVSNAEPIFVEKYIRGNEQQTEMIYLYYVIIDKPASAFIIQKEEVEQVQWFDYEEALKLYIDKKVESTDFIVTQVPKILQFVFEQSQRNT